MPKLVYKRDENGALVMPRPMVILEPLPGGPDPEDFFFRSLQDQVDFFFPWYADHLGDPDDAPCT